MEDQKVIVEIDSDEAYEVLVTAPNGTRWLEAHETSIVEWLDGKKTHRIVFFEFQAAEGCYLNHAGEGDI